MSIPPRLPIKRNPKTSRMMPHAGLETLPAPTRARIPTRMLTIALVKKSRDRIRGAKFRRPLNVSAQLKNSFENQYYSADNQKEPRY